MTLNRVIYIVVGVLVVIAATITVAFNQYRPELWVPSLVCNLATTALAIAAVNILIARYEKRAQKAQERALEARRAVRAARRKRAIQAFLGTETYWPVLVCISAGHDVMLVARHGMLPDVIELLRKKGPEYRYQAGWLRTLTLTYSRYFKVRELRWLNRLQANLEALADHPGIKVSDDMQKLGIVQSLGEISANSRALMTSFALAPVLDEIDEFHREVGELRRRWDIPGIRKRVGNDLAPLFEKEHPDIAMELRGEEREEAP